MRLFVAYSYSTRDQWIEELVFPLVNALGCEVIHGKAAYGESLAPTIKDTLLGCDALLGFTTRRESTGDRGWTTHRWVIEELASAFNQIPVVEVREDGVDPQLGMLGGHQHILYREEQRDRCLVAIAEAIARLLRQTTHTVFKLEPSDFTVLFRALLSKPGLSSTYRVMRKNIESGFLPTKIWPVAGGLAMSVEALRPGDLIQVCVSYGDHSWMSDYEPIDAIRINLFKQE